MRGFQLAAAFALASCATPPLPPASGPRAGFGEVAVVGDFRVVPLEILEDSRCPVDVQCVWAGRVRLRVQVSGAPAELTLGETANVAGTQLTLVRVEPQKRSGQTAPVAYRFTFAAGPRP
jgi:hypothetical protein